MAIRKKVLWLVSWYPNKYDRFDGDFIQRHARAAALFDDVHVLFVKASEQQGSVEEECNKSEGLAEQIIYFPKLEGVTKKVSNYLQWQSLCKKAITAYCENGLPHLIHVHIPWKVGLIALWLKKKYKLPFIVTEHWGIYNGVAGDNIHTKPFLQKILLKRIFKEAAIFISVSKFLGEGVNTTLVKKRYTVLPNVADTELFYPGDDKYSRFTFLHVSNMVALKNVGGIIMAFQQFKRETNADAQLILVGDRDNQYHQFAQNLGLLDRSIFFRGEIPYEEVAKEMRQSHVFIVNSTIENSPCVIGEALCCGLPVIATNVGGIPELVNETNSLLVTSGNDAQLSEAMAQSYSQHHQFNMHETALGAKQKFSFAAVGEQFHNLYSQIT